jgi:hypothetical protein
MGRTFVLRTQELCSAALDLGRLREMARQVPAGYQLTRTDATLA